MSFKPYEKQSGSAEPDSDFAARRRHKPSVMQIRIRIREQLCLVIAIFSLLALTILAVTTWTQSRRYMLDSRANMLQVTANLKADALAQEIALFSDSVVSISTRDKLQTYMQEYNRGNMSEELRVDLAVGLEDANLEHAIAGGADKSVYLQAAVYPRSGSNETGNQQITKVTGLGSIGEYQLPYTNPNGSKVYLGVGDLGYPPTLYPNFTYSDDPDAMTVAYESVTLHINSTLLLGPLFLESNTSLISMTVAVLNNTSRTDLLGWLTVVLDARNLYSIIHSRVGLGSSGEVVIIGPAGSINVFNTSLAGRPESENADIPVQFELPPYPNRHPARADNPSLPFPMSQYPAVLQAWSSTNDAMNNASHLIHTHNENNASISVGYARIASPLVDWVLVFGQTTGEVMGPVNSLRNTILACVFSVVGAIIIICFPLAHYAVKPIQALRTATNNSVTTYEVYVPPSIKSDTDTEKSLLDWSNAEKGFTRPFKKTNPKSVVKKTRAFQIPERVPEKKHLVHDELTDLTCKFNEMADELSVQYARLEEHVKTRTAQLEHSRDEARAANESKTLFIANVSHELRTPLNGIIGMCAVAMQEEHVSRIRQSLKIIYKSSDLLLHLLNDLLTFSRSSYGQQLSIEEGSFRLVDVGSQLVSIFEKQAKDADVGLKVVFLGPFSTYPNSGADPEDAIVARQDIAGNLRKIKTNVLAMGPADTGPLRRIGLRGDKNRILQILMNLVSNSLKFTPAKGQIEVRIRCKGMVDLPPADDMSNAYTVGDALTTPGSEMPTISIRKASEASTALMMADQPHKGLIFDFEVEDTGSGIPEHLQQEIFKPFVQGDLTLSKKHGGTGLGLAICSQLAEMMGGDIRLKSTVDVGSTFVLSLPLKYTKETVPSVSGSLAVSARRLSMSSSVQFDTFSAKSGRSKQPRTQPQSARASILTQEKEGDTASLEHPRIVGYSQPFILDDDDGPDEKNILPGKQSPRGPGRRSPQPSRKLQDSSSWSRLESIQSATAAPLEPAETAAKTPTTATVFEAPNEQSNTLAPATAVPKSPAMRVLVAEDNQVNQQVILRLLKLEKVADASVTLAEDGQQALTAVQQSLDDPAAPPYTLVFMDIQMPKMDGIEATKRIRALGFDAPIIALTAFDHETNRKNCEEVGMNAFLGKPIKRTALKGALEEFKPKG
ncbi:uncharacterized protein HMPREF1541_03228 [Cyphellophora europaea CBS 101466]|uniref:histidine kinase n=1 Tax=Cyphellophora europaea (strain CBS 101466) TaxID=1220924 RepID=W2RZS2_CYPE1|nr:uncharacterized protein HMPREF1541_03228 [Cyphellophora europaea CBS 101466]ETN41293.1 hypothetical protein HMPREF1541_03228 [Cyphellophora europaea CBS 101466]